MAAKLWNDLPTKIKNVTKLDQFNTYLKIHVGKITQNSVLLLLYVYIQITVNLIIIKFCKFCFHYIYLTLNSCSVRYLCALLRF